MIKIINVVGARPNFMKVAPIIEAMRRQSGQIEQLLVHTGQHYDEKMSKSFFHDLGMPRPDINLEVGSGSHAEQTAKIMVAFEKVCVEHAPDLVLVVGDVNSTLACTITAKKLGIKVAHVEAGLRSRDIAMPEEINRLCTDVLSDFLFTTDRFANANLKAEGVPDNKVHFVGNVMIDTLVKHREVASRLSVLEELALLPKGYATLTLHRPSNVDDPIVLSGLMDAVFDLAEQMPVVFPVHPRTRQKLTAVTAVEKKLKNARNVHLVEPLGYLEFLHLNMHARLVLTDSGGLQEETTVLGTPCITLRENTERPITCSEGTNVLVGNDPSKVRDAVGEVLGGGTSEGRIPELWDGRAAERIVEILLASYGKPFYGS